MVWFFIIGKGSDLSPIKIGEICGLLKENRLSQYDIANILEISRSSVKNIKNKEWILESV